MADEQTAENNINQLIQEMMKQMTTLQEKVDAIQRNPIESSSRHLDSEDNMEDSLGGLVQLTEMTKSFLEAAFSGTMSNADRRKNCVNCQKEIIIKYGST